MKIILGIFIILALFLGESVFAQKRSLPNMQIVGANDPSLAVNTRVLNTGERAIVTSGTVTIEQLFGQDPQGSTYFYLGTSVDANGIGLANDTIRIQITAAAPPLNVIYPAVDVTTTVTALHVSDSNPERVVAEQICIDLEADANFISSQWRCIVMSDYSGIFIHSNLFNEFGFRVGCVLPLKCFDVSATGTTVVTEVFTEIEGRGFEAELSRSPNDPRKGQLAISGSISINAESINNAINDSLKEIGGSDDMAINGGAGTVFDFKADATNIDNFFINAISCSCQGNGIQFGKFCSINNPITNGVGFTIISEGVVTVYANIHSTDDFKHEFTQGDPTQFGLDIQSGLDDLMSSAQFTPPILLSAGSGDLISALVRDNLSSLALFRCRVFGFKRRR